MKMQDDNQRHGDADIYKDVVIIGNGPSGICLSYMLAGNWPHYTGGVHPNDDMLTARLRYVTTGTQTLPEADVEDEVEKESSPRRKEHRRRDGNRSKIVKESGDCLACKSRRDFECLSSGLEGRNSGRPLSLLMDQLQHPGLDAGLDAPSLLSWKSTDDHSDHKVVDHVVLGKGPPGGAWHALDPNVLTISLNMWMSLPGLDFRKWELSRMRHNSAVSGDRDKMASTWKPSRILIGTVAAYYQDYVVEQNLEKYFRSGTTVTSVRPIPDVENTVKEYGWLVEGHENETGKQFRYRCRKVVLASGTTDSTNHLEVPGENMQSWVIHDLNILEKKLDCLVNPVRTQMQISDDPDKDDSKSQIEPLLVVGAGLSAADAIMAARFRGIPVLHVFRDSSKKESGKENKGTFDKLHWLPASMYPEYHKVYEMMSDGGRNYPLYRALPDHQVVNMRIGIDKHTRQKTRKVTMCTPQGRTTSFRVSFAAILIGSKPNLSYLKNNGVGLGKVLEKPIDNRSNPIDVDAFTYEVLHAPRKGLYALGPLAGDNFVRFILGGAFGTVAHIIDNL